MKNHLNFVLVSSHSRALTAVSSAGFPTGLCRHPGALPVVDTVGTVPASHLLTGARVLVSMCKCPPSVIACLLSLVTPGHGGSPGPYAPPLTSQMEQGEMQGGDPHYKLARSPALSFSDGVLRVPDCSLAVGEVRALLGQVGLSGGALEKLYFLRICLEE